jgi:tetratricopeptide (TPR) repeat protein
VFLPGRQGSLQIEMLAGARRQGAVATLIPDSLQALMRELHAGHPVVVLLNLGLSWAPSWHYAVAVGYDTQAQHILLRSGPMKRQELNLRTFMHTWNRSERWAFVSTRPNDLPVTATQAEVVKALVAFERNAPAASAAQAYRTGLARWPDSATLAMGLGNTLYAAGDQPGAEATFRQAAEQHHIPAAYNNLARLLLERGQITQARQWAERGLDNAGPLRQTLLETLKAIETTNSPR